MSTRCWSCMLGLLILLTCSNVSFCEDWSNIYQADSATATDLSTAWTVSGDWVSQAKALHIKSDQESLLRFNTAITDPVIQIQFDLTCTSETFTEAGVLIGFGGGGRRAAAQFIFQGGESANAQLIVPARAPMIVDNLKFTTGQSYRVKAIVNELSVQLLINDKQVAKQLLFSPLSAGQVALFATQGNLTFDNLQIRTKKISDAQAAQQARNKARDLAIKAQFETGYVPPIWDPSQIQYRERSARVRIKQVPLKVQSDFATPGQYPLSVGVPIEDRQMFKPRQFRLLGDDEQEIPCQITPISQWDKEDAIKWVMVDTQIAVGDPTKSMKLTLEYGRSVPNEDPEPPMPIETSDDTITVDTGKIKVSFNRKAGTLIDAAWIDGKPVMAQDMSRGGFFVDNQNVTYRTGGKDDQYQLVTEVAGSMHTIIRASGWYVSDVGQKACRYVTRVHLYKNQAIIRMEHTWIVTVDTDQFWFTDLGMNLPMTLGNSDQAVMGISDEDLSKSINKPIVGKPVSLTQNDLAICTVTQDGKTLSKTQRSSGWASLLGSDTAATIAVRDMAMQFPNRLEVTDNAIVFHAWQTLDDKALNFRHDGITKLWGQETWQRLNDNVTSQGVLESRVSNGLGFARTHHLTLTFHESSVQAAQVAGALGQVEPIATLDPNWVKETQALPLTLPVYDESRFGEKEAQIKERYDEYLKVATHLEPMVGFWDYGRGCPSDVTPGSGDRWTYSGINANEDMSYGNPQVPWLLYLRSGDRKYLQRARAMTTHVMDTRIMHWHAKSLGREIGQSYKHTGTWVFDGSDAGWTGDIWAGFLATAYHMTGNQRSIDVLGEIAYGYTNSKRRVQNYRTVSYLGAIARYYLTCFDPKLRDVLIQTSPIYLQYQNETGFWPSNDQDYEYALLEMLKLPRAETSWENTSMIFARGAVGPMRFHTQWSTAAGIQAWAYEHKQADARFGVNAQEALENGIPKLTGEANLAPLRRNLIWMGLSDIPGISDVIQPRVLSYARPQESVFYLKHESGKETHIELHCKQAEVNITDLDGKPISPNLLRSQRTIGIYEITLGENLPETQYRIEITPPCIFQITGKRAGTQSALATR